MIIINDIFVFHTSYTFPVGFITATCLQMHPHFPDIVGVDQFAEIIQLFSYLLDDIVYQCSFFPSTVTYTMKMIFLVVYIIVPYNKREGELNYAGHRKIAFKDHNQS